MFVIDVGRLMLVGFKSDEVSMLRDVIEMSLALVDRDGSSTLTLILMLGDEVSASRDVDRVGRLIDVRLGEVKLIEVKLIVSTSGIEAEGVVALRLGMKLVLRSVDDSREVGTAIDGSEIPGKVVTSVLSEPEALSMVDPAEAVGDMLPVLPVIEVVDEVVQTLFELLVAAVEAREPVITGTDVEAEYGGIVAAELLVTMVLPPEATLTARLASKTTVLVPLRADPVLPQPL